MSGPSPFLLFVGSYARGNTPGLHLFAGSTDPFGLRLLGSWTLLENPTFLVPHPLLPLLYAVSEVPDFQGSGGGAVAALRYDPAAPSLELLQTRRTGGPGPCYVSLTPDARALLVANYGGGSVASYPLGSDGSLGERASFHQHVGSGPNPRRQDKPHAHCILSGPDPAFVYAADLGCDRVFLYRLDPVTARLTPEPAPACVTAPGAGPRHLTFHPSGRFAYLLNELHSTVSAFRLDPASGRLDPLDTYPALPHGFPVPSSGADIHVHPHGELLYSSNRGHDSLAVFRLDPATGALTPTAHESVLGATPRNFALHPGGRHLFVARQNSDSLALFHLDPATGALAYSNLQYAVPRPVCLRLAPLP